MEVIEQTWGYIVKYGYNAEQRIPMMSKLNSCFDEHPKCYDALCKVSEGLKDEMIGWIKVADDIWHEEDKRNGPWSSYNARIYDIAAEKIRRIETELDVLHRVTYVNMCNEEGFGYCI